MNKSCSIQSILGVEWLDELILEESVGRGSGHVFQKEEHAVKEWEFFFIQEPKLQGSTFVPDVNNVVLLFLHILDPLEFWHIELG